MPAHEKTAEERLIGRRIGGYTITRCVGKGGMGMVYEATHQRMSQRAAVKVLGRELFHDEKVLQRFFNEAKALSIVQHPSIVKVFEFGQLDDGTAFIMMEFLDGEPLLQELARAQRLGQRQPLPLLLERGRQIAAALAISHEKGVVHRDLKPENVFILPDPVAPLGERVKLLDFGIAKFLDGPSRKTTVGTILGTPLYMAPEQCEGRQDLDEKVDVYALGVMLYEMLAGRLPFDADTNAAIMRQHLFKEPPPLTEQAAGIAPELGEFVHRMLAKQPAARPGMLEVCATMGALLAQADGVAGGLRKEFALHLVAKRPQIVIGESGLDADPQAPTMDSGKLEAPARPAADKRGSGGPEPALTPRSLSSARLQLGGRSRFVWLLAGLLVLAFLSALAAARFGARRQPGVAAGSEVRKPAPEVPARTPAAEPAAPPSPASGPAPGPAPAPLALSPALTARQNPPKAAKPRPGAKRSAGIGTAHSAPPAEEGLEEPWR